MWLREKKVIYFCLTFVSLSRECINHYRQRAFTYQRLLMCISTTNSNSVIIIDNILYYYLIDTWMCEINMDDIQNEALDRKKRFLSLIKVNVRQTTVWRFLIIFGVPRVNGKLRKNSKGCWCQNIAVLLVWLSFCLNKNNDVHFDKNKIKKNDKSSIFKRPKSIARKCRKYCLVAHRWRHISK